VTIEQGKKGLKLRYGKYVETVDPGLVYINSITERIIEVDCRINVIDMPKQKLMTKGSCLQYLRQHIDRDRLMRVLPH
jgi:erythrocyte band 7 integral membrane protein